MARHVLALLLLLASAAGAGAAGVCNPCSIAYQLFLFCPNDDSRTTCCDVVKHVIDAGHDDSPACLCRLDVCQDYLLTGYDLNDLLTFYVGCGGKHLGNAVQLVRSCDADDGDEPMNNNP